MQIQEKIDQLIGSQPDIVSLNNLLKDAKCSKSSIWSSQRVVAVEGFEGQIQFEALLEKLVSIPQKKNFQLGYDEREAGISLIGRMRQLYNDSEPVVGRIAQSVGFVATPPMKMKLEAPETHSFLYFQENDPLLTQVSKEKIRDAVGARGAVHIPSLHAIRVYIEVVD